MTDTLEATGRVTGIEERPGGFRRISVDVGRQFPLRVDTKLDTVIQQAREAMEWDAALVRYTEQESKNTNPNTGEPYTNRYVKEFLPVTPAEAKQAAEASKGNGGSRWSRPPEERLSIERQSAARTAFDYGAYAFAKAWSGTQTELELYLFGLATRLEAHVARAAEDTPADDERPPLADTDEPVFDSDVPFE